MNLATADQIFLLRYVELPRGDKLLVVTAIVLTVLYLLIIVWTVANIKLFLWE